VRIADSDEVVQQVVGINNAASYAVTFVFRQVEHWAGVAGAPVHLDQLRSVVIVIVVVAGRHAVAGQPPGQRHAPHLALVAADQHSRHVL
jgi:hypothetical protein